MEIDQAEGSRSTHKNSFKTIMQDVDQSYTVDVCVRQL